MELELDVRIRDSTSVSAAHTLEVFRVTEPYNFAQTTWTTAGPAAWTQPGGSFDPTQLASTTANPATLSPAQDLVFSGNSAFSAAILTELAGDKSLDLLLRSDRENSGRSFFWLASREDDGVSGLQGPRLRVRSSASGFQLVLRSPGTSGNQTFRWVNGASGILLKEEASGRHLSLIGDTLEFTLDAAAATSVQLTEPETSLRLNGRPLDERYLWTWFGALDPTSHPWCFHAELGWIHLGWETPDAVWGWRDGIGWIYTSASTYPLCFSQENREWMLVENLPDEGEVIFTGLSSRSNVKLPSAVGFDVAVWMETGVIPAPPSPPPSIEVNPSPLGEPILAPSTRLLAGPGPDSWRLVTHGAPDSDLVLTQSADLLHWSWQDQIQTIDHGPIVFHLANHAGSGFWRVGLQAGP